MAGDGVRSPAKGGYHWKSAESPAGSDESCGSWEDDALLGDTLTGDALCRTLIDKHTANELGLVRSEVRRLRTKIEAMEREKEDMVENFVRTTRVFLDRIKELEAELSESQSRPQTAAIIERIENRPVAGKPPLPLSRSGRRLVPHVPEVLRIDEEQYEAELPGPQGAVLSEASGNAESTFETKDDATSICGNCGKEIPSSNIVSHTTFCYRNTYRCTACGELIAHRDRDAHFAEWTEPGRLFSAMEKRDVDIVQQMIEHRADLARHHPESQDTPLHIAARLGDAELIGFCIGFGVEDVNPANRQGTTPLHCAVESGDFQAVKLLVELGADLNASSVGVEPPLMLACRRGVAKAARLLVEMRADLDVTTPIGDTALDIARSLGHQETVMALATVGAPLRSGTPTRRARSNSPHPLAAVAGPGGVDVPSTPTTREGAAGYPPLPRNRKRDSTPNRPQIAGSGRGSGR